MLLTDLEAEQTAVQPSPESSQQHFCSLGAPSRLHNFVRCHKAQKFLAALFQGQLPIPTHEINRSKVLASGDVCQL